MVERTRLSVTFYLLCLSCCLVQRHEEPTQHRPNVTVTHPLKCTAKRRETNKDKISFIYPPAAQLDCSKMLKFTLDVLLHVSVFYNHHQGVTIFALLKL
jgi:hypothetical protein